jgi:hypothetical protein
MESKSPRRTGGQTRTTNVSDATPLLRCQSCDSTLTFINSITGGVAPVEHWDRYICGRCGTAHEYRRRTRRLQRSA